MSAWARIPSPVLRPSPLSVSKKISTFATDIIINCPDTSIHGLFVNYCFTYPVPLMSLDSQGYTAQKLKNTHPFLVEKYHVGSA